MNKSIWKRLGVGLGVLAILAGGYYGWMMMPGGAGVRAAERMRR